MESMNFNLITSTQIIWVVINTKATSSGNEINEQRVKWVIIGMAIDLFIWDDDIIPQFQIGNLYVDHSESFLRNYWAPF